MKKMNSSLLPTSYFGIVNKKSEYLLKKFEVDWWMNVFLGKTVKSFQFCYKKQRTNRCAVH